jgi:hypothetical protein
MGIKMDKPEKKAADKTPDKIKLLKGILKDVEGSGNAEILDDALNILKEVKVESLYDELKALQNDGAYAIVFDGVVSQRLIDIAKDKGVKQIVAVRMSEVVKKPSPLKIITGR